MLEQQTQEFPRPDRSLLAALFPSAVAVAVWEPGQSANGLYPAERAAVARAVDKRRTEFALGRTCARDALARLGAPVGPIPVGSDRAPIWPAGYVGSITHCDGFVAAIAARRTEFEGIGVDAERSVPLGSRLARMICTEAERAGMDRLPPPAGTDWAKVVFSAKEAVHKAVAPITGVMLSFQDVEIDFDPGTGSFATRLVKAADHSLPDFTRLAGRFLVSGGLVVTSVCIPTGDSPAEAHMKHSETGSP